ncbi:MAG: zf-HC2 domain-containing protein [Planctomycetes bacterium]|nr:zf-HC2 domain-containing protein [Planctomycetota bacterium]
MSCLSPLHQRLSSFALGELDRERALELVAHVEICATCGRDLDLFADLVTVGAGTIAVRKSKFDAWRARMPRAVFAVVVGFVLLGVFDQILGPSRRPVYGEFADRSIPTLAADDADDPVAEEFAAALDGWGRGEFGGVAARLDPFLDVHPDHARARFQRAIARRELGQLEGARSDLRLLVDNAQGPVHDEALWVLANLELQADDPTAALSALARLEEAGGEAGQRAEALAARVRDAH